MNHQLLSDGCLEALREDLPTAADERRIRSRLAAAGLGVTAGLAPHAAGAAIKAGVWSAISARFVSLPLLTQMILVAAGTTAVATPPLVLYERARSTRVDVPHRTDASAVRLTPPIDEIEHPPTRSEVRVLPAVVLPPVATGLSALSAGPPSASRKSAGESPLVEEARLLDAALAAIRGKELRLASELIEEHARRFPDGTLVSERERARRKLADALAVGSPIAR